MKVLPVITSYNNHFNVYEYKKHSTPQNLSFKGTPEYMSLSSDNLVNYDKLSHGSYLDIHDDSFAPQNKAIRTHNLSFLDSIDEISAQKKFIDHYKSVTGFPNLAEVSKRIENTFINSVKSVALGFDDYKYNVIAAGYDGTCSVGKRMSLPGSDLDKAFIILNGDYLKIYGSGKDEEIVGEFKNRLWHATDQRILSYNHDTSFPSIMTINQIKNTIAAIREYTDKMSFDRNIMAQNVKEEYLDLIKASDFNIMLSKLLPKRKYDDPINAINKENIKNFAYFIEAVRDGKIVITSPEFQKLTGELENNDFYKYSNVAQMRATKNAVEAGIEQKTKILLRKELEKSFSDWSISKQFEFIKTLIRYSCEDNVDFKEYFTNDRDFKETYKPLLGLLCYGDENRRLNPEFKINSNSIDLYLEKSNPVSLYRGFSPDTMWIESYDSGIIEDVLLHIDKLRKTKLFEFVSKVQAPLPIFGEIPKNFGLINYYTKTGRQIIERTLK